MRYRNRISGPLLDRIDIQIEVPAVPYSELSHARRGESSATIRKRVISARKIQEQRFRDLSIHCNSQMSSKELRFFCKLSEENRSFLEAVASKLALSARAFHRIIKIGRTIADLEESTTVTMAHLSEAVQYRSLDRERI
ncbi:MAG: ATP-binding protein [Deltaproteobacteria bacterium]|nr:ATP-binding protein [Deltaproteobacteria bacterium]